MRSALRRLGSPLMVATLSLAGACGGDEAPPIGGGPPPLARPTACAELDYPAGFSQQASGLVNASRAPLLPLTHRQKDAFVAVWSVPFDRLICSGTLIGEALVLTAEHCVSDGEIEVRFGARARSPDATVSVAEVRPHPELDLALLELSTAPPIAVTPIPLARTDPQTELVGAWLETAGFGQSLRDFDERAFLPVRVQSVLTDFIDVQGGGRQGLCFGDSGAPLLTRDPERRDVRLWGVLSEGDSDCLGRDRFALIRRADAFFAGATVAASGPPTCGDLSIEGRCTPDGRRLSCGAEGVDERLCPEGCGWDESAAAHRCRSEGGRCVEGCDGTTLRWCERGKLRDRDCDACGELCVEEADRAFCAHPLCAELGTDGRCAQDVVEWCDETGRFRQFDCRGVGQRCLPDPARCESVPEDCDRVGDGLCVGSVRIYCVGSTVLWESCATSGETCTGGDCS